MSKKVRMSGILGVLFLLIVFGVSPSTAQDGPFLPQDLEVITVESAHRLTHLASLEAGGMCCADFGANGLLAARSEDEIWVWNVMAGSEPIERFPDERTYDMYFSPDGRFLVDYKTWRHTNDMIQAWGISIWDSASGEWLFPATHGFPEMTVAFHQNYIAVAYGGSLGVGVWIYSLDDENSYQPENVPLRDRPQGGYVALAPDGSRLLTSGEGSSRVWDLESGEMITEGEWGFNEFARPTFSPEGDLMVVPLGMGALTVWNIGTGEVVAELDQGHRHDTNVSSAMFSPDGRWLAVDWHNTIVWNAETFEQQFALLEAESGPYPRGMDFSPDSSLLAFRDSEGYISLWGSEAGTLLGGFSGMTGRDVSFNPEGTLIETANEDGTIWLWGVPSVPAE